MYAAFYNNLDIIEILSASEARFQLTDAKGRNCLHYAALNDADKVMQTIFLVCKTSPKSVLSFSAAKCIIEPQPDES